MHGKDDRICTEPGVSNNVLEWADDLLVAAPQIKNVYMRIHVVHPETVLKDRFISSSYCKKIRRPKFQTPAGGNLLVKR